MNKILIGNGAFISGLVLAVLIGLIEIPHSLIILATLGLIVGFLNIEEKESTPFLISVIALILIGLASLELLAGEGIIIVMQGFLAFVSAAGLVVAIKEILVLAKPGSAL